ncbi:MAG: SHOCT domain-containing protein [Gaiellaceae bacterium]
MNEQHQRLLGPMMRHGGAFGVQEHVHGAGTSCVEWAILGLTIAILVGVVLLLADRCRHRRHHRLLGWNQPGGFDKPLAIVRMRYSRGEMSREEYQQALEDLGASPEQKAEPVTEPAEKAPRRRRGGK